MTSYLLSIDPSIKNTGFTLGEDKKPIGIGSFSFNHKNLDFIDFQSEIFFYRTKDEDINLIIERGTFHSKNGIGYETQEHLRGFIAGQFNKLITKDMLISPKEGQNGCLKLLEELLGGGPIGGEKKGCKEYSLKLCIILKNENNGNITISNHDETDSLLIGLYYLNKDNK